MDQETKAFIEEVKKRDTYISLRFIEIDDYHKAHADRRELLKVIEEQEKEIERLEAKLADKEKYLYTLSERLKRFYINHHPNSVKKVIGFVENNVCYALTIKNIITTNDGAFIEVYLPPIDNQKKES